MLQTRGAQIASGRQPLPELSAVELNVCGSAVRNLFHFVLLSPVTLRWTPRFLENLCSLALE